MATHSIPIAVPQAPELTATRGWGNGFTNLLRKEFSLWWRTRRWLVHLLIWLVFLNGFVVVVALTDTETSAKIYQEAIEIFFMVGAFAAGMESVAELGVWLPQARSGGVFSAGHGMDGRFGTRPRGMCGGDRGRRGGIRPRCATGARRMRI